MGSFSCRAGQGSRCRSAAEASSSEAWSGAGETPGCGRRGSSGRALGGPSRLLHLAPAWPGSAAAGKHFPPGGLLTPLHADSLCAGFQRPGERSGRLHYTRASVCGRCSGDMLSKRSLLGGALLLLEPPRAGPHAWPPRLVRILPAPGEPPAETVGCSASDLVHAAAAEVGGPGLISV